MPSRNEVIGIVVTLVVVGAAFSLTGIMQGPTITGPNGEPIIDSFGQPDPSMEASSESPEVMLETNEVPITDGGDIQVVQ